jgi:hypothetical protein
LTIVECAIQRSTEKWTRVLVFMQAWFIGWLQGRVVRFLRPHLVFCRVACIYMLLTWRKKNNFSNLWLDLDFQKIITYIHQIYSNELLKLKNMDWFIASSKID